ncbi:hypothetical protein ACH34I_17185 [Elizabethkingia anophelis]
MKTKLFKPLLGAFLLAFMLNSCKRDITSEGETNPQPMPGLQLQRLRMHGVITLTSSM